MMQNNLIYTVAQINSYIHGRFEADSRLRLVTVKGELSNVKYHSAGHIYFTLKDSRSSIAGVMFSSSRTSLDFLMSDGQEVLVTGSISTFERDGKYQIYARDIKLSGDGALYERYEKLKAELGEMGMFDAQYKKQIPAFVKVLGVVTAPTGAAVRDIINVSRRRFPYIQIVLYPAKVQGNGAAESICAGIQALDDYGVDCIIVGRGGGSIEDLWAFNEEIVARTIFACSSPVISAVGHETDTTIADWVADLRAPTPSAAAELAVFDYEGFIEGLSTERRKLISLMKNKLYLNRERLNGYKKSVELNSPKNKFKEQKMMLAMYIDKLHANMTNKLDGAKQELLYYPDRLALSMNGKLMDRKNSLKLYAARLQGLSPLLKLSQGYSVVEKDDKVISSVSLLKKGDNVKVHLLDGSIDATVQGVEEINR